MTGSTGGAIGGNSGASFGSGLGSVRTSPTKPFTPALETWVRRSQEDVQMKGECRKVYEGQRDMRLAMVSEQSKKDAALKRERRNAFTERQKERLATEEAEKRRVKTHRQEALEKPTLGSTLLPWHDHNHARLSTFPTRSGSPPGRAYPSSDGPATTSPIAVNHLSQPVQWQWATVKKHPDAIKTLTSGLGAEHEEALATLPPNVSQVELDSYVANITKNSHNLSRKATEVRRQRDAEVMEQQEKEKAGREEAAIAMRKEEEAKAAAKVAADLARSKRIKKEMAAATAQEHTDNANKEKSRYEKAQNERRANVQHLMMDLKLRDEDEIANERREGSSMALGGKDAFVATAVADGDMSAF